MIGHKLNGATIIAAVPDVNRKGETVIVVEVPARPHMGLPWHEYVTGVVASDNPTPTEWHAGHYFSESSDGGRNARARAMADMLTRAGWAVEVAR